MSFISERFFFESLDVAVEALLTVLEDARETDKDYSFGSLSTQQILSSGLLLVGDAEHLASTLKGLPGVTVHSD